MHRALVGPISFIITFLIGFLLVGDSHELSDQANAKIETAVTTPPAIAPIPGKTKLDNFHPEFLDLPNLGDFEAIRYQTKLVDVFEYGNNYSRNEAIAKTGQVWLGLFETKGKYSLQRTSVRVVLESKAKDPDYEDSVRLQFDQKTIPVFILKNAKSLRPGAVATTYHRPSPEEISSRNLPIKSLTFGYYEEFHQFGDVYKLRVAAGTTVDKTKVNVLVLETKDATQVLTYNLYYRDSSTVYNSIGDLLWIGDLDGDNKLDLYFSDFGFEKGGFGSNLFLSTEADPEKLVKQIATFGTSGC